MRKIFILGVSLLAFQCFAASPGFEAAINLAKEEALSKKMNSYDQAKHFNPQAVFDRYTSNPNQTKYYQSVDQKDTQQMDNDKIQGKVGESGTIIADSIKQHPHYVIKQSDPDIKRSQLLQSEAYNIVHGMTIRYVDCKPKVACTTQYQEKQCEEAPQTFFQSCKKKLNIEVIPHENVSHYELKASLSVNDHNYAGINVNTVNGHVEFLGPRDSSFGLRGRLPDNMDCHTLEGKITSKSGNARLDHINFPSCSNGLRLDFHISGGHNLFLKIDMTSKVVTHAIKDHWIDECGSVASDAMCKQKSQQCDIARSTQIIREVPVTRDCWQQGYQYMCRSSSIEGNCKPLQSQGCEQIGSECKDKTNGYCSLYRQTYRCAVQACSPITDVICGNGQEYCLDGNCTDHRYQESNDFAKSVSALSAVAHAAKQLDQSSLTMFTGRPTECSEKPIGFSNCCTEKGWGIDIGLEHCSDDEKKLHVDRENKLAIKVGRYCANEVLGVCVDHAQVFCVFNSKLAKIIQEQGRSKQLHINFGEPEYPRCDGITAEQLQAMDLSKIDFQDFIKDLSKNVKTHDLKQVQELIKQHVEQAKTG